MSLTYEPIGDPIARILPSNKLVYIDSETKSSNTSFLDEQLSGPEILELGTALSSGMTIREFVRQIDEDESISDNSMQRIELASDESIFIEPNPNSERIAMIGGSGGGKSTLAARYAVLYHLMFPDRPIYLFCRSKKDPAYMNSLEDYTEILPMTDPEFMDTDISLKEFKESLVIFDDCDNIPDKKVKAKVYSYINDIFSNGRKLNVTCIYAGHLLMKGLETKTINAEANRVFLFTGLGDKQNFDYLKTYAGMFTAEARNLINIKSRWFCISRSSQPRYLVWEKGIEII